MPQIIVLADGLLDAEEAAVMLRERVTIADFESGHFGGQLLERLAWAVGDAHEHERNVLAASVEQVPAREQRMPAEEEPRRVGARAFEHERAISRTRHMRELDHARV